MIEELYNFIDTAEKNRKYPANSAYGSKAALQLFEKELSDEEKKSIDLFEERQEQIFNTVYQKYKEKYTLLSLQTYKRRVQKVLADYRQYGNDPQKMANWNPRTRISSKQTTQKKTEKQTPTKDIENSLGSDMRRSDIPLNSERVAILFYPKDSKKEDAIRIKGYAAYLESIMEE